MAARYRLPAIYGNGDITPAGGLMSYDSNLIESLRQAASYVDRILRGAKPGDLPVQNPTKYTLSINLKTAKALGLTVPRSLLIQAGRGDQVKRSAFLGIALFGSLGVSPVGAQQTGKMYRVAGRVHRCRRAHILRNLASCIVESSGDLCRPYPQRCETR